MKSFMNKKERLIDALKFIIPRTIESSGRWMVSIGVMHYGIDNIDNYGILITLPFLVMWTLKPMFE